MGKVIDFARYRTMKDISPFVSVALARGEGGTDAREAPDNVIEGPWLRGAVEIRGS